MKISDAKILLKGLLRYNIEQHLAGASHKTFLVPYFIGDPGVGKTAFIAQVAEEEEIPLHTTIIAQYDAGELGGFGIPTDVEYENEDGSTFTEKRVIRARPDYLPDPRTAEGVVALWNLDELPQAFLANQNICSQLVNDWRVGEHHVSHGVTIVCTGNRPENKAGTTTMPMHLKDRLMFILIEAHFPDFELYANQRGIHRWVRAYLSKFPSLLHEFTVGVNAFPSPRSWEKTSRILSIGLPKHIQHEAIAGQIGDGQANQFLSWVSIEDRIPNVEDVIRDPMGTPVFGSQDADILHMLITNLVDAATMKNAEPMTKYLKRLPNAEFKAIWCRNVLSKHPDLNDSKHVTAFKLTEIPQLLM